jgi:hypothetical protein
MGRVIAGLVVGIVIVAAVLGIAELVGRQTAPGTGLAVNILLVAAAYFGSAAAGASAAGLISRRSWTVWAIALLVTAGSVWTVAVVAQPLWMQIVVVAAPLLGGLFARALVAKGLLARPAAPADA